MQGCQILQASPTVQLRRCQHKSNGCGPDRRSPSSLRSPINYKNLVQKHKEILGHQPGPQALYVCHIVRPIGEMRSKPGPLAALHTYTHTHVHTYTYTPTRIHTYPYAYAYTYTYTYTCTCTCTCTCIYLFVYMCYASCGLLGAELNHIHLRNLLMHRNLRGLWRQSASWRALHDTSCPRVSGRNRDDEKEEEEQVDWKRPSTKCSVHMPTCMICGRMLTM